MADKIPKIPDFILEAYRKDRLVLFIGNGVPRIVGGVSWDAFANALLEQLCDRRKLSFGEYELLKQLDPKKKISIAFEISEQSGKELNYKKALHLDEQKKSNLQEIYQMLFSTKATIVTTNYDLFLAQMARTAVKPDISSIEESASKTSSAPELQTNRKVCSQRIEFNEENLSKPGTIFYLHGSVVNPPKLKTLFLRVFGTARQRGRAAS